MLPLDRLSGVLLVTLLLSLSACGSDVVEAEADEVEAEVIDLATFTKVMAGVRVVARDAEDEGEFEAGRDSIFEAHGVDEDALIRFAEVRGGEIDLMHSVLDSIRSALGIED